MKRPDHRPGRNETVTRALGTSARAPIIVEAAELLRLMGNPNRLAILSHLASGEAPVSEMEERLGIRQPTLSQQLAEMRKAGLVRDRREAKSVIYRLTDARTRALVRHIHEIFRAPPADPAPAARNAVPHTHAAVFGKILTDEADHSNT